ncbi:MAG: hypothetical protein AB7P18_22145 [Candidatus Binatia bacterium]
MSYTPRLYDEIVRDLLTTLTGGTVGETVTAPSDDAVVVPTLLKNRPVRRVSHLQGRVRVGTGATEREIAYKFTAADFDLVSTSGDENNKDAIRFREGRPRPIPGSPLLVNYYPVQVGPVPVTDLNVGSVVRTLVETVGRELAQTYLHLDAIYKSAFLETAEGRSLDKVVALVGVQRLPVGVAVARVRFSRREGTPGRITVPVGTAITDADGNRYLTLDAVTLEPGESTREVMAGGEHAGVPPVEQDALNRLEVLVAGIAGVRNTQPARRLSAPETDEELRRRTRGAFHGVVHGTLDALRFQLLSMPEVKDVSIQEFPNGVAGEVKVDVAYNTDTAEIRARVEEKMQQVKAAGIRIISAAASRRQVDVRVQLTLAGTGVSSAELTTLTAATDQQLAAFFAQVGPGATIRRSRLAAVALADPRVVDAQVFLQPVGEAEVEELTLAQGEVLEILPPIRFSQPLTEQAAQTTVTAKVSAILPVHLVAGVTLTQANQAIQLAVTSHLTSRRFDAPLTVDGLAAAIRDDSRFALIRGEVVVTVESGDRFFQLTDGLGSYAPAPNETLQKDTIDVQVREGEV